MAFSRVDSVELFGSLLLLACSWIGYELLFSPLREYPGPFVAKFTDLWRAFLTHLGNVDSHHREWHRRYGTAVRVGPNTVSIDDPDLIKVIYTTKNAWLKSDMYKPNDVVVDGQRIPNVFNTSDKVFHAKLAKPIGGFWTLSKVLELEPLMDETLTLFTNKLGAKFADGPNAGNVCMMDDWLTYFAWDSAGNVSFAKHYGFIEQERDVGGMIRESTAGLHYFASISQVPRLDNWLDKNPWYRIGPKSLVNGFLYTMNALTQYQRDLSNGAARSKGADTFMDKYNSLMTTHPDLIDNDQVVNYLMLNVLAGGDSTAGAMRSIIYHLGRNPHNYQRLVTELEAAQIPQPAQWQDISKLAYLDACILEAERITPPLGLMLERYVPECGLHLPDGRFIPAGTKVGINPAVITRDAGVFGFNVNEYDPDRWLQRTGESDDDYRVRRRRMQEATDFMFGAGNRVCMGKHMAKLEIYKLFATLYSMFDIQLTDPNHEWQYCNSWFMYQRDIPMTLTRRGWK